MEPGNTILIPEIMPYAPRARCPRHAGRAIAGRLLIRPGAAEPFASSDSNLAVSLFLPFTIPSLPFTLTFLPPADAHKVS